MVAELVEIVEVEGGFVVVDVVVGAVVVIEVVEVVVVVMVAGLVVVGCDKVEGATAAVVVPDEVWTA